MTIIKIDLDEEAIPQELKDDWAWFQAHPERRYRAKPVSKHNETYTLTLVKMDPKGPVEGAMVEYATIQVRFGSSDYPSPEEFCEKIPEEELAELWLQGEMPPSGTTRM